MSPGSVGTVVWSLNVEAITRLLLDAPLLGGAPPNVPRRDRDQIGAGANSYHSPKGVS